MPIQMVPCWCSKVMATKLFDIFYGTNIKSITNTIRDRAREDINVSKQLAQPAHSVGMV